MLFSIIVPVYNASKTLDLCIQSVLKQNYQNFELVLVDDGSTDNSYEICQKYFELDNRIQLIHQSNLGHSAARTAGLVASKGEYILFLDSDDWFEHNLLQVCKKQLSYTDCDLIFFGYYECGSQKKSIDLEELKGIYKKNSNEAYINQLVMNSYGQSLPRALWGKVFKRALICKWLPRTPPQVITGEDMCCVIAAGIDAETVCIISGSYYNYRINSGTLSRRGDEQALNRCTYIIEFLTDVIPHDSISLHNQFLRLIIQQIYSALVRSVFSDGDQKKILSSLNNVLSIDVCIEALNYARFSSIYCKIKQFILKHRLIMLVKPLYRLKHKPISGGVFIEANC